MLTELLNQELLNQQRNYINYYFDKLDLEQTEHLVHLLFNCKGTIFFTGVGKSGLIAKKIAFTMASTGTRALYLSPINALHGDLGIVCDQDVFIMMSKSGESDELLQLVPAIRNKQAIVIAIVCNAQSRLALACQEKIILPFQNELCPFDLAPTTSTAIQLLFGDLLTIALMRRKNFSIDQYALNHPSGRIGRRITLRVADLMLTDQTLPLCSPEALLEDILVDLSNKRCGCVLIVDAEHRLLGIFTDGDLRCSLQKYGTNVFKIPIKELMTPNPRYTHADVLAFYAMKMMEVDPQKRITVLPVVDHQQHVVGLIHLHDIIQSGL
jgi:arabinose-5-phosphate isomerase